MVKWTLLFSLLALSQGATTKEEEEFETAEYEDQFSAPGCTAILVGRGATVDGSTITTHNNDCMECDSRVALTEAKRHPAGSLKTVYHYKADYPHMVNTQRSPVWHPENLDPELVQKSEWSTAEYMHSLTLGTFEEVETTYALVEGVFGIMNEKGLGMGESTCSAVWFGKPARSCYDCEGPLVDIAFLQLVALERCETARCAIELMGSLASKYGYYAVEQSSGEGGEAITIIDTEEAWMFHILPDKAGDHAIWAAQRVPDEHVAVCANTFVIRDIDPANTKDFMFSDNMYSEAEAAGLWSKGEPLDFAKIFGGYDKAYSEMSTRRHWRVFDILAPSLKLPDETDYLGDGLPFSVKPEKKLTPKDIMTINRDYFQGTKFDLSKGVAGGPYGDPRRFDGSINRPWNENNLTVAQAVSGGFERAISVMRTAYSTVLVSRATSPANELTRAVVWIAQYAPHLSVFTPIYVAAGNDAVPEPLSIGSLWRYDTASAYWRACVLGNWASHFFRYTIKDVQTVQDLLEYRAFDDQMEAEKEAQVLIDQGNEEGAKTVLASFSKNHCDDYIHAYNKLFELLVAKFHDGYSLADPNAVTTIDMRRLFYPRWWLKVAGYWSKFDKPIDYEPWGTTKYPPPPPAHNDAVSITVGDAAPVSENVDLGPVSEEVPEEEAVSPATLYSGQDNGWLLLSYVLLSIVMGGFGYALGMSRGKSVQRIHGGSSQEGEGQALNTVSPDAGIGMRFGYGAGSAKAPSTKISYQPAGSVGPLRNQYVQV